MHSSISLPWTSLREINLCERLHHHSFVVHLSALNAFGLTARFQFQPCFSLLSLYTDKSMNRMNAICHAVYLVHGCHLSAKHRFSLNQTTEKFNFFKMSWVCTKNRKSFAFFSTRSQHPVLTSDSIHSFVIVTSVVYCIFRNVHISLVFSLNLVHSNCMYIYLWVHHFSFTAVECASRKESKN